MEYTANQEKLKLWTEHVKKASSYNGSLKGYWAFGGDVV